MKIRDDILIIPIYTDDVYKRYDPHRSGILLPATLEQQNILKEFSNLFPVLDRTLT